VELRDLIVTPIVIILVYFVAYLMWPWLTNSVTRKYFFPALTLKIIGALAVGFIYQFYYSGGDTYNYHTHGSRIVWEAFMEYPSDGIRLLFSDTNPDLFPYASRIFFYTDPSSYFVIKIAAVFDLITFSTYSATAVLFAFFGFIGVWFFFLTFYQLFPHLHKRIAICSFFVPSVFFWGSGLLKDTIIMGCLGIATFLIKKIFIDKSGSTPFILLLLSVLFVMFSVKKYVIICFVPAALFWVYAGNLSLIRSAMLKLILLPLLVAVTIITGFYAMRKIGESDSKYALDKIARTAQITAYDIRYYTGKDAGSGYSLGELDGTFANMLKLAPQAVNVSLFRPYLWEVKNILMLLSALEAFVLLLITSYLLFSQPFRFFRTLRDPNVLFCFVFSITFAFAVGVSTYNFGTLSRYKIPMLPFYTIALVLIADQSKSARKLAVLEETE